MEDQKHRCKASLANFVTMLPNFSKTQFLHSQLCKKFEFPRNRAQERDLGACHLLTGGRGFSWGWGMRAADREGEVAKQGCGLSGSLASAWSHRELWSVNCTRVSLTLRQKGQHISYLGVGGGIAYWRKGFLLAESNFPEQKLWAVSSQHSPQLGDGCPRW